MAGGEWRGDFRFGGRADAVKFESKSKQDCLRRRQVISELLKNKEKEKEKEKERLNGKESGRDRDRGFFGPSSSSKPIQRPLKPVRPIPKAKQECVKKLKDARDFTFLFNEGGSPAAQKPTSNGSSASEERKASEPRKAVQKPQERKVTEVKAGKLAQEILKSNSLKPPVKLAGPTAPRPSSAPPSTSKPTVKASKPSRPPVKPKVNPQEAKKLKEGRDYSFLFDDGGDSKPRNERPNGSKDMPPRSSEKKVVSSSTKMSSKPVQPSVKPPSRPATAVTKTTAKPVDRRPLPDKRVPDKRPLPEKRPNQQQGVKRKHESEPPGPSKQSKPLVSHSKPQPKTAITKNKSLIDRRHAFRDLSSDSDEDEERGIVKLPKQFRYAKLTFVDSLPQVMSLLFVFRLSRRYRDDGYDSSDSSNMEVGFSAIQAEEARSARIARQEDEEQLKLIEEEERQERLRKRRKA
ncbi:serine/arginine repetitive matrix protein 1-like isoform X2 [Selaginella moellendorffii]|uniref:serine/arginine repetitive matrix protein 1-like isoform X2 n=1 Tax=Selaginella moellendorffii TaxID=88036 RepID=UPI000D1D0B02|nr:serine/arginine repetitive matrix protein 1-like isoform X2 [Selaginella moellendorffii]|eukprot:XP_024528957.1 serine/arginine repetitive matrix protein 1-like isoform X2 [Selaginella moellendorffii]